MRAALEYYAEFSAEVDADATHAERVAAAERARWERQQLGPADGMPEECAASLDNLRVVPKVNLTAPICTLGPAQLAAVCTALGHAVGC